MIITYTRDMNNLYSYSVDPFVEDSDAVITRLEDNGFIIVEVS